MSSALPAAGGVLAARPGQYLTFVVGECHYGLDIQRVQEIKGLSAITPIPGAPAHVLGVMNLRGTVLPVLDLRSRFGTPRTHSDTVPVIIVVTVADRVVGVVADGVTDVPDITADRLVPPPDLGPGTDTSFLAGMARTDDRLIALLTIDRVVGNHTLDGVPAVWAATSPAHLEPAARAAAQGVGACTAGSWIRA